MVGPNRDGRVQSYLAIIASTQAFAQHADLIKSSDADIEQHPQSCECGLLLDDVNISCSLLQFGLFILSPFCLSDAQPPFFKALELHGT